MANLSLREAVKLFDVSRPTLTKALNKGVLSGVRNGKGHWSIDPAELSRVYQAREQGSVKGEQASPENLTIKNTQDTSEIEELRLELAVTQARAEAAEKLAEERSERIEDLRRMLPAPNHVPRRRWWQRS